MGSSYGLIYHRDGHGLRDILGQPNLEVVRVIIIFFRELTDAQSYELSRDRMVQFAQTRIHKRKQVASPRRTKSRYVSSDKCSTQLLRIDSITQTTRRRVLTPARIVLTKWRPNEHYDNRVVNTETVSESSSSEIISRG